jgi:hypothetical protein
MPERSPRSIGDATRMMCQRRPGGQTEWRADRGSSCEVVRKAAALEAYSPSSVSSSSTR